MTKSLTSIDEYVCHLSKDLQQLAEDELREDEKTRDDALKSLRTWIETNPRIDLTRMDGKFLLRFLRAKKFSVPMAQDSLERYILLRCSVEANLFHELDYLLPRMTELVDLGYLFPLPKRDHLGRRVIFYRPGVFDPKKHTNIDMIKIHGICVETILENEEDQIRGVVHMGDLSGLGLNYLTLFTPKQAVRIVRNGERIVPMRHKVGIVFNLSSAFKFAADFGMTLISEKMRKRIHFYKDVEETRDMIDKDLLPKEYGGQMPMKEMIELWKEELKEKRDLLLLHDEMAVKLDLYTEREREGAVGALKKPLGCNEDFSNSMYGMQGSFRKLEVD